MKKRLTNNIGMKILSVVLAVLVWLLVANSDDPVTTEKYADIPVKIINESVLTELGYAYEILEGSEVTVTVKGKASILRNLNAGDFSAVADFSKLSMVDAVPIDVTAKKYNNQLEITLGNVNTMKIKRDELTSISLPVNIVLNGEVSEGQAVGVAQGNPNLVKVTGPTSVLNTAKEVRAEVNIDGISQDITTTVKPEIFNKDGEKIKNSQIKVDTESIAVSVELWNTKMVKVKLNHVGKPASGYGLASFDYEPKAVTIAAPDDVLGSMESITLTAIDLGGMSENYDGTIEIPATDLPKNTILVGDQTDIKVKATIERIINKDISISAKKITVKGNHNGYKVSFKEGKYKINLDGAKSLADSMDEKTLAPWINIEDLYEGDHTVTLHVKEPDGIYIKSVPDIQITLK